MIAIEFHGFKIMAGNRVKLFWSDGTATLSLGRVRALLRRVVMLDPANMPVGTRVTVDASGMVTTSENFDISSSGRKPKGERPMSGAERQRLYMARLRGVAPAEIL